MNLGCGDFKIVEMWGYSTVHSRAQLLGMQKEQLSSSFIHCNRVSKHRKLWRLICIRYLDLQVPYVLQEEVVTEIPQQQVVEVKREETPESWEEVFEDVVNSL